MTSYNLQINMEIKVVYYRLITKFLTYNKLLHWKSNCILHIRIDKILFFSKLLFSEFTSSILSNNYNIFFYLYDIFQSCEHL